MLKKINFEGEEFYGIVGLYYQRENFQNYKEIFLNLTRFYDEIKENINSYDKIFKQLNNLNSNGSQIFYTICMKQIKLNHADFYLLLVKYLNNFCEETLAFIKVILHIEQVIKCNEEFKKIINFKFENTQEIFRISNTNDLKTNTFVEIYGNIKKVSNLKQVNTKLNVFCSSCGLIFTKNLMKIQNKPKVFNVFSLNNDKKFHQCDTTESGSYRDASSNYSTKIYKEYSDPIAIRYFVLEIFPKTPFTSDGHNDYRKFPSNNKENNTICCSSTEEIFVNSISKEFGYVKDNSNSLSNSEYFPFWKDLKIFGIVKTRPEGNAMNNENFYEKIVDIIYTQPGDNDNQMNLMNDYDILMENPDIGTKLKLNSSNILCESIYYENSLGYNHIFGFVNKLQLDEEDYHKIIKLSSHVKLSSFFLMSLLNSEIPKEINFLNVLFEYFIFSKDIGLKIHLFNSSKTENFSSVLNFFNNLSEKFLYHNFKEDLKSNDELVTIANRDISKIKTEDFNLKFAKILSSEGKFLILDNISQNIPTNLFNFLYYNNCLETFRITSFQDINSLESNFRGLSSILSTSEVLEINKLKLSDFMGSNFSQVVKCFDMISFYSDKINSEKDRKKTNKIFENHFNNRKRKFPYGFDNATQEISQNLKGTSSNFNFSKNSFGEEEEELYELDSLSFTEFHNNILKNEFHQIKNDNFLSQIRTDKKLLQKYLTLANEFVPIIPLELREKITFLSKHLMKSFPDLNQFDLKDFDENGENLEKILIKLSLINSRMELKFYVQIDHVIKAYIFTKEIVQQNFIFFINNKVDVVNKTKKNKISFVIERIRQMCASNSKKVFTKSELKEACDVFKIFEDIDNIIENLNFMGFMIKLNSEEYQIIN